MGWDQSLAAGPGPLPPVGWPAARLRVNNQFAAVPPMGIPGPVAARITAAWLGGLFDGDGCDYFKNRQELNRHYPHMDVRAHRVPILLRHIQNTLLPLSQPHGSVQSTLQNVQFRDLLFPGGPAGAGQGRQHPAYILIKAQHLCLTHFRAVEGRQASCAGSASSLLTWAGSMWGACPSSSISACRC